MKYARYAVFRDKAGVTDYAVAKGIGAGKSTFYDWKQGKYTPKIDKLLKIAEFLKVPISEFLGTDE